MIVALAALSSRELYRLSHATGQAKAVLAGDPDGIVASRPLDGERKRWFRDLFANQFGPGECGPRHGLTAIARDPAGPSDWAGDVGLRAWG